MERKRLRSSKRVLLLAHSQHHACPIIIHLYRVSSVLNRDSRQFGKKYMFDGLEETCWNSDQVLCKCNKTSTADVESLPYHIIIPYVESNAILVHSVLYIYLLTGTMLIKCL